MDRLLMIDDDRELCEMISEYLAPEGFKVEAVYDGDKGLERALSGDYSLVLLDVMLPGLGGFDLLRKLRATSNTRVLLLTARGEEVDRIVGLEIGADDYLPKPFNTRELTARIRAILRRTAQVPPVSPNAAVKVGDVELNPSNRVAKRGNKPLDLTSVEFDMLRELMRNAGQVVSRDHLSQAVLGRPFSPFDRSIDMHISKLRKKLGELDGDDFIRTVRNAGYLFPVNEAETPQ